MDNQTQPACCWITEPRCVHPRKLSARLRVFILVTNLQYPVKLEKLFQVTEQAHTEIWTCTRETDSIQTTLGIRCLCLQISWALKPIVSHVLWMGRVQSLLALILSSTIAETST